MSSKLLTHISGIMLALLYIAIWARPLLNPGSCYLGGQIAL